MDQRLSVITLAVAEVARSRAFYVDGLGWEASFENPGRILMLSVGPSLLLSLWAREDFIDEVGPLMSGPGHAPITLAHNVGSPEEVHRVLDEAAAAGAEVEQPVQRDWGGFSGYFADPDGFRWEIAYAPTVD